VTAPRAKIEASLAERGRPAMWANEGEAAVLSGYSPERFRGALPALEKAGFPQVDDLNGLRYIPAILNFWSRRIDTAGKAHVQLGQNPATEQDNGRQPGKWGAPARSSPLRTGS
jgi:hypothetical protein